jgi:leader peptidase (prepilin peptidase)/N-methyltransferase
MSAFLGSYAPLCYVLAGILGLMLGSFMNVVVYRLPRKLSVVRPRSFCPRCRRAIPWYENIPVASYIVLRARCRGCGAPIPARYPVVEAAGALLALVAIARFGFTLDALFAYAFLMALLAITIIDWQFRIIPDELSVPFIAVGIAWAALGPGRTILDSCLGALVAGGALWGVAALYKLVRKEEGLGGGDIKLMAMVGACLGLKLALVVILLGSFAGTIYGLTLMRRGTSVRTAVAFGSFLAPAAAVSLLVGPRILAWYSSAF